MAHNDETLTLQSLHDLLQQLALNNRRLHDKVNNLSASYADIVQQPHAHHVAIGCLEHSNDKSLEEMDVAKAADVNKQKGILNKPIGTEHLGTSAGGATTKHDGVPKFHKLKFSVFDGREDPLPWLHRCEH